MRLDAPDLFDKRKRQREHGASTAHKQRLRNNQGKRDFQSKAAAHSLGRFNFNLTVKLGQVRPHYIQTNASPGQFSLARSGREAGLEEKVQQLTFTERLRAFRGDQ